MATNFPTSLDTLTNPTSSDSLASPSHSAQHANVNDAVEALQAKVGVDGSAVTSSLDYKVANQGLVHIKSATISANVASVTLTDVFSSTFDNYRILVNATGVNATSESLYLQLGATTSGYNWASTATSDNSAIGFFITGLDNNGPGNASIDLYSPNLAERSVCFSHGVFGRSGAIGIYLISGVLHNSTQYTGFTVLVGSPYTIDGGTIKVYGYNNG